MSKIALKPASGGHLSDLVVVDHLGREVPTHELVGGPLFADDPGLPYDRLVAMVMQAAVVEYLVFETGPMGASFGEREDRAPRRVMWDGEPSGESFGEREGRAFRRRGY